MSDYTYWDTGERVPDSLPVGCKFLDSDGVWKDEATPPSAWMCIKSGQMAAFKRRWPLAGVRCLDCTIKHLGSAAVLIGEYEDGNIKSGILAVGHLNEAQREGGIMEARLLRKELIKCLLGHSTPEGLMQEVLQIAAGFLGTENRTRNTITPKPQNEPG